MNQRNFSIDILKFVCATLIVVLHTNFKWHDEVLPMTRCAVPCFLIISGFLLYSGKEIGRERLLRNIKQIVHILLWTTILFAVVKEIQYVVHGKLFIPSIQQWLSFVVLNDNPFGFHLWYLGAYLYVLLIMMIVDRFKHWKFIYMITPVLLLGDLALGKYSLLLLNHEYPYVYVRNFLFVGIPYFTIGIFIKQHIASFTKIHRYIFMGGGNYVLFNINNGKNYPLKFE